MQWRLNASKTIARPQFRELAPQQYLDFDSDRVFYGNPFLTDSKLTNLEARYEWFFGKDQRITAAGFFKKIEDPIETVSFQVAGSNTTQINFANAPEAQLYGAEFEVQKYVPLDFIQNDLFTTRRLVLIANYTYTAHAPEGNVSLEPYPNVRAWLGRIEALPGFVPMMKSPVGLAA